MHASVGDRECVLLEAASMKSQRLCTLPELDEARVETILDAVLDELKTKQPAGNQTASPPKNDAQFTHFVNLRLGKFRDEVLEPLITQLGIESELASDLHTDSSVSASKALKPTLEKFVMGAAEVPWTKSYPLFVVLGSDESTPCSQPKSRWYCPSLLRVTRHICQRI